MIKYQSQTVSSTEMTQRAEKVLAFSQKRRSVREFSNTPVSKEIIEKLILTAGSAPSGANMQPWTFCAISDAALKKKIRTAAEKEEYESYTNRMNKEWLKDLEKFETNWQKPFLEEAPWIIIVFKQSYGLKPDGSKKQHYYVNESVGLACGFLIKAIHECGLVTLTHTPSPMGFLSEILERPVNEKPFLLLPVGYASENAMVPKLEKKSSEELINWY
ncbi:nitroreductase family protein [Jiulongibacter sp. NS-SX5]|uniref:nitroreductase family protein n=1 Tax=Jiulongibacter sp. NS-SX5 TaxID=3463854 RepID=UPI0040582944